MKIANNELVMRRSISSPTPSGHDSKRAKTPPRNNHCVQRPYPWDKTGSQGPIPAT